MRDALRALIRKSPLLSLAMVLAASPAFGRGDGTFRFPLKIEVGDPPVATATGDFNRDGKLDLAVVHGTRQVTILLQDPARRDRWHLQPPVQAGLAGFHLRSADFDRDGAADLALADPGSGAYLLRSRGDGSFEEARHLDGCSTARWLAVGDWNGDGRPDLASACYGDYLIVIYLSAGDGQLTRLAEFRTAGEPHSIQELELDRDGRPDLLIGANFPGILPLLGREDGSFEAGQIARDLGICYRALAAADFDGDGLGDPVSPCAVFRNRGDGTFASALDLTGSLDDFSGVAIGDLDGDRAPDLAAFNPSEDLNLTVHAGTGDARFRPPIAFGPAGPATSSPYLSCADLDGDGRDDVICPDGQSRTLTIFWGASGRFLDAEAVLGGIGPARAFDVADLDRDGVPDLAVPHLTLPRIAVYRGFDTAGPPLEIETGQNYSTLRAADLDGDGLADLAGTSFSGGTALVALLDPAGKLRASAALSAGSYPAMALAGLLDEDSSPDLVVPCAGSGELAIFRGLGGGLFGEARTLPTIPQPRSADLGDLDSDGLLDVAVVTTAEVAVHFGKGGGELSPLVRLIRSEGKNYTAPAIDDLEQDGTPELLAAETVSRSVQVFRRKTPRSFEAAESVLAGAGPSSLALADLDGDALPDLIAAGSTSSQSISVLLNRGPGGFAGPEVYRLGFYPLGCAVLDLNRDGALDLAAVSKRQAIILYGRPAGPDGPAFRRGDADGDGRMELNDAVRILSRLFLGGEALRCEDAADANDDGAVELADPISILSRLFLGGPLLPTPGPEACGPDPTPDRLAICAGDC